MSEQCPKTDLSSSTTYALHSMGEVSKDGCIGKCQKRRSHGKIETWGNYTLLSYEQSRFWHLSEDSAVPESRLCS